MLDTLTKLTRCTPSYREEQLSILEVVDDMEPCKNCWLTRHNGIYEEAGKKRYGAVFLWEQVKPEDVKVMFVSRDPNFLTPEECESRRKQWPGTTGTISRSEPLRNRGISDGVIRALVGDPIWESLEKSIRGQVEALPIYWTHLVKCYACNNSTYLPKAAKTCVELLEQEIDYLDPELIIGFGNDVQSGLSEVGKLTRKMKEYEWLERLDELAKGDIVILPLPGGRNRTYIYQWEKRDITEAIKVIGRNLKDYELGHTFSLQPLKYRITELLHL